MRAGPRSCVLAALAALFALQVSCGPKDLRVEPADGDGDGGQVVRIVGSGFLDHGPVAVYFGARSARSVVIEDDRRISTRTPEAEAFGAVDVRVEFADGTVHELPQAYTYLQIDGKPLQPIPFRPGGIPVPTAEAP